MMENNIIFWDIGRNRGGHGERVFIKLYPSRYTNFVLLNA